MENKKIQKKEIDEKALRVFIWGLAIMLILRDVAVVSISKYIYLAFSVLLMMYVGYETLIYMLCFMLPLVCGLPGTYIMPCALILLMIKRGNVSNRQISLILFAAAMEIIASIWYPESDWATIVQYISFAGVMLFLIHDNRPVDHLFCVRMYLYGVCLLCCVIITTGLMTAPEDWLERFAKGQFRFGYTQMAELEGMALKLNANSLAYYSITGITCGIFMAEKSKGTSRIVYILIACIAFLTGFMTVSRSWVLVAAICLLLYLFSKTMSPKRLIAVLVILVLFTCVFLSILSRHPELLEGFTERFSGDDMETGNGRTDIFKAYMEAFLSNPRYILIGTGVTQYKETTEVFLSFHNGLQQILVSLGIIGSIVFMSGLIRPIRLALRTGKKKRKLVDWLPFLGIVLFTQTIQFLNPMMLMLPYIIGIYALKAGGQESEKADRDGGHRGGQPLEMEAGQGNNN